MHEYLEFEDIKGKVVRAWFAGNATSFFWKNKSRLQLRRDSWTEATRNTFMNQEYSPFPLTTGSDILSKFMVRVKKRIKYNLIF
ncbi:MAG: hypothetical protein ACTSR7_19265 [Promethearchaeota archaeon]